MRLQSISHCTLGRVPRCSTVARVLWLAVAALHAWLVVRRFVVGDWTSAMDIARAVLCLAGVGYASLKFWRIATVFDAGPRRAMAFALVLLIGHWVIAPPKADPTAENASLHWSAVLAVLPAAVGVAWAGALAKARRSRSVVRRRYRTMGVLPPCPFDLFLPNLIRLQPVLFRRPPPIAA